MGGSAWKHIFNQLASGSTDVVDSEKVADFIRTKFSSFSLAESKTWRAIGKQGLNGPVTAVEFESVMLELRYAELYRFFGSLDMAAIFAAAAQRLLPALDAQTALHPLHALGAQGSVEREQFAAALFQEVSSELVGDLSAQLAASHQYHREQSVHGDIGKFSNMILGPSTLFSYGLEKILPYPASDVLIAIEREHTLMDDSQEVFEAHNDGRTRRTTPQEQWEKVMPHGRHGPINPWDYEGHVRMCESFETHPLVVSAKMQTHEVVAVRLYSGPMFVKYNTKLRMLVTLLDKALEAGESVEDAVAHVSRQLGAAYANTIHAINSALIKLSRVTHLPPGGKAFRGMAGLGVPPCFLVPDQYGCRGGVEGGFLSTSVDKATALGYIQHERGLPVQFELQLGVVNRGASIGFLSYFPTEEEILFPPLSSLEVNGAVRYEMTDQGLVMIIPLGLNMNLKGRTIEELHDIRKDLHGQIAMNAISEVHALLAEEAASTDPAPHSVRSLVQEQCTAMVKAQLEHGARWFNEDANFGAVMQDVVQLKPLAACVVDMAKRGVGTSVLEQLQLQECLGGVTAREREQAVVKLWQATSKLMGLFQEDVNEEVDGQARSPLMLAARDGNAQAAHALLHAGASVDATDTLHRTALYYAAAAGHETIVVALLSAGAKTDIKDRQKRTALHGAAEGGNTNIVDTLLGAGLPPAIIDSQDEDRYRVGRPHRTALHYAAAGGHAAVVVALLQANAKIDITDVDKKTALHCAAEGGHPTIVDALLAVGLSPHSIDSQDQEVDTATPHRTALHYAAAGGHAACVQLLLEARAKTDILDRAQKTVLHCAAQGGNLGAHGVDVLVAAAAAQDAVDKQDDRHRTALHYAAAGGHNVMLAALLKVGANKDIKDDNNKTVLHMAAEEGHVAVVEALLAAGLSQATIDSQDEDDGPHRTALHYAAEFGDQAMFDALIAAGASTDIRDADNKTVFHLAAQAGLAV